MKIDSEKLKLYGLISALIAITIFVIGTSIAMIVFTNYSFTNDYFSELGIRGDPSQGCPCGISNLSVAEYPEIFNITIILTGIFLLPFFPIMFLILNPKGAYRKLLPILVVVSGISTSLFLSFVGVFDAGYFYDEHTFTTYGLYYCIIVTCLAWGLSILFLNKDSPYKQSRLWIIDPLVSLAGLFIGVINARIFGLSDIFTQFLPITFYQKLLAYLFMIFFGFVSIRSIMIKKSKRATLSEVTKSE